MTTAHDLSRVCGYCGRTVPPGRSLLVCSPCVRGRRIRRGRRPFLSLAGGPPRALVGSRGTVSLVSVVLAAIASAAVLVLALVGPADSSAETMGARIGGDVVPSSLSCEEDEVIGYAAADPSPRSLRCVHVDEIREEVRP